MDTVSRWLLITRASVFPMTIISGLIGGLLAAAARTTFARSTRPTRCSRVWFRRRVCCSRSRR
jgi:hypothetical protein